jgi:class 3 adenylate cyclase
VIDEGLLADHSPGGERKELRPLILDRGSAAETATFDAPNHQDATAEVDEFFGLEPHLAPFSAPPPLEPHSLFATVSDRFIAEPGEKRRSGVLDVWVVEHEDRLVVSAVRCLVSPLHEATDKRLSQPRARWQPQDRFGQERQSARGVHTGECELFDDDIGGIAVHIAARVNGLAGAGEVLVSGTVKDLVVGSEIEFAPRGQTSLKGIPGRWPLFTVESS